jgi:hypothetical protein
MKKRFSENSIRSTLRMQDGSVKNSGACITHKTPPVVGVISLEGG